MQVNYITRLAHAVLQRVPCQWLAAVIPVILSLAHRCTLHANHQLNREPCSPVFPIAMVPRYSLAL